MGSTMHVWPGAIRRCEAMTMDVNDRYEEDLERGKCRTYDT